MKRHISQCMIEVPAYRYANKIRRSPFPRPYGRSSILLHLLKPAHDKERVPYAKQRPEDRRTRRYPEFCSNNLTRIPIAFALSNINPSIKRRTRAAHGMKPVFVKFKSKLSLKSSPRFRGSPTVLLRRPFPSISRSYGCDLSHRLSAYRNPLFQIVLIKSPPKTETSAITQSNRRFPCLSSIILSTLSNSQWIRNSLSNSNLPTDSGSKPSMSRDWPPAASKRLHDLLPDGTHVDFLLRRSSAPYSWFLDSTDVKQVLGKQTQKTCWLKRDFSVKGFQ
ncbi:unnamed protein product [Nesidiocoris tenuis]|uniref:Uncharacterized protein n=1 Tax=Nesidiocoris tenuis TaxID=355587 RepID=A0A6H5H655_9HEMI|nr:unnamed protein product [Nesidiocoris tenuis]